MPDAPRDSVTLENVMPYKLRGPYLYAGDGRQFRIIGRTRRHVTVATARGAVQLSRQALERTGEDVSGGVAYRVNHRPYPLSPSPKRDVYVPNGEPGDDPWTQ